MNTKQITSRLNRQAADQKLADGLTQHAQTLPFFLVAGALVKTEDITAALQARLTSAKSVESTRAAWLTAVKADADERAKSKTLISGVRQTLEVMYAGQIANLADYGLAPRKRAVLSPEKKNPGPTMPTTPAPSGAVPKPAG